MNWKKRKKERNLCSFVKHYLYMACYVIGESKTCGIIRGVRLATVSASPCRLCRNYVGFADKMKLLSLHNISNLIGNVSLNVVS